MRRWRLLGPLLLTLGFLSTLSLHAYLGTYSRYIADDFCSAATAHRFGILRAVWYWYLTWTGRYSASALDAVFGVLGPAVTPIVPVIVLLVWLTVLIWTARLLAPGPSGRSFIQYLTLAASALFLTLAFSPNVPQALYWGQGMRSIVPPLILSAVYLNLLLTFSRQIHSGRGHTLWLALSFLIALFVGGLNETFTALEVSLLVFALILALILQKGSSSRAAVPFLTWGVVGATLAFLIVVSAPGNAFRQAYYPAPPGPAEILKISFNGFLQFIAATFGRPDRLAAVLGVLGLSVFLGMQGQPLRTRVWLVPLGFAAALAFSFLCFLPAAYGLSDVPPDRTLMIPSHLIALAVVSSGYVLGRYVHSRTAELTWRTTLEAGILALAALACLTSVFLADRQLLDDRQAYADYASHWEAVNAQIVAARRQGQTQVVIQTMPNWADLNEPNDNPKFWLNVCYREYYGIEVLAGGQP